MRTIEDSESDSVEDLSQAALVSPEPERPLANQIDSFCNGPEYAGGDLRAKPSRASLLLAALSREGVRNSVDSEDSPSNRDSRFDSDLSQGDESRCMHFVTAAGLCKRAARLPTWAASLPARGLVCWQF